MKAPDDDDLARACEWLLWLQQRRPKMISPRTIKSVKSLLKALDALDPAARPFLVGLATHPRDWPPRDDLVERFTWAARILLKNLKTKGRPENHDAYRFATGFLVNAWRAKGNGSPSGKGLKAFQRFAGKVTKQYGFRAPGGANVRRWLTKRPPTRAEFEEAGFRWPALEPAKVHASSLLED